MPVDCADHILEHVVAKPTTVLAAAPHSLTESDDRDVRIAIDLCKQRIGKVRRLKSRHTSQPVGQLDGSAKGIAPPFAPWSIRGPCD
jgi:hypothetical protein